MSGYDTYLGAFATESLIPHEEMSLLPCYLTRTIRLLNIDMTNRLVIVGLRGGLVKFLYHLRHDCDILIHQHEVTEASSHNKEVEDLV